ncbi:MAG: alpha/beta hydrolase family esterase [Actinomycetota bacterium]
MKPGFRSLVVWVLVLSACGGDDRSTSSASTQSTSQPPASNKVLYPHGESQHVLEVDGIDRSYLVYLPVRVSQPRAVVFVLHGGGGDGLDVASVGESPLSVFRSVADREGFLVVYPEGRPAADRQGLIGWTDCRNDNTVASGADDVGFLASLVRTVSSAYELPFDRVFMAGSSNGAQMSQTFAFHHPDLVGAIASNAGSQPQVPRPGACTTGPSQPVPILLLHGTADPLMPFDGGCVADLGGACNRGRVVSAEATRDRWLVINGLFGETPIETITDIEPADGGTAHRFVYDGSAPVEWWRLDNSGHAAPSRTVMVKTSRLAGVQNRDIEFAEVAWAFFERQLSSG